MLCGEFFSCCYCFHLCLALSSIAAGYSFICNTHTVQGGGINLLALTLTLGKEAYFPKYHTLPITATNLCLILIFVIKTFSICLKLNIILAAFICSFVFRKHEMIFNFLSHFDKYVPGNVACGNGKLLLVFCFIPTHTSDINSGCRQRSVTTIKVK